MWFYLNIREIHKTILYISWTNVYLSIKVVYTNFILFLNEIGRKYCWKS